MSVGGKGGGDVTTRVNLYYAGWHMVPCLGAEDCHLYSMQVNDTEVLAGDYAPGDVISIFQPEALGGYEKEGGVVGFFDFMGGGITQAPNTYLQSVLGNVPAYRGVVSIVARRPYLQANNPYLFPWKFKLGCFHGVWYQEKREIYGTETYYTEVTVEDPDNYEEIPESGACNYSEWSIGNCEIKGYPPPWEFENGALIDDPDSWMCVSDDGSLSLPECYEWQFTGTGIGTGISATTTTVENTRSILLGVNPAHIIHEALVNQTWGRGISPNDIDDTQFRAAADLFYTEGLALSIKWDRQSSVYDFIQTIVDHAGAILTVVPGTGLYTLIPIRDGQSAEVDIQPGNILVFESYEEKGWAGITNEMTVTYTDINDGKKKSVTVHDLAAIQRQGSVISETRDYPGLPSLDLAQKIAERDLAITVSAGSKLVITTDRISYNLLVGSNFSLTWPEYGLNGDIYRVMDIDYGLQDSNSIRISAISDAPVSTLFQLPSQVGLNPPAPAPSIPIINANPRVLHEAPYWHVAKVQAITGFPEELSPYESYLMAIAGRPQPTAFKFVTLFQNGAADQVGGSSGLWSGSLLTMFPVSRTDTDFSLNRTYSRSPGKFLIGTLAMMGGREIVEVVDYDPITWHLTVNRGMLDTVPIEHDGPVLVHTLGYSDLGFSYDVWLPGDSAKAWLRTVTNEGTLDLGDTSQITLGIVGNRQGRPLPPGGLLVGGVYLGVLFNGALALSWTGRNRLTQTTDTHTTQHDGNVIPEPNTQYRLRLYGDNDTMLREEVLVADVTDPPNPVYPTGYIYDTADELSDTGTGKLNVRLRVELLSERDGYQSWTSWEHTAFRAETSSPVNLPNGDFASGLLTPWQLVYGTPSIRSITEPGWPSCGTSGFLIGNNPASQNAAWAIFQQLDLRQYTSQDAIDKGLTVFEIMLSQRAEILGPVGEMHVDYFDVNEVYLSTEQGPRFHFAAGNWRAENMFSPNPAGAVFAKLTISASGEGGQNSGHVGCVAMNIHGRLGEKVYVTTVSGSAITDQAAVPDVSSGTLQVLTDEVPAEVASGTLQVLTDEQPAEVASGIVSVIVNT